MLADLALLRAPHKRDALVPALQGCMRAHHRFLLHELIAMIETLERAIDRLDREIEERLAEHKETLERLDPTDCPVPSGRAGNADAKAYRSVSRAAGHLT